MMAVPRLLAYGTLWLVVSEVVAYPAPGQAQDVTAEIWTEMGAFSARGNGISDDPLGGVGRPAVAINQVTGDVYVVWEASDGQVLVKKWNGAQWAAVGGAVNGGPTGDTTLSAAPAIAVRESDGHVFVAWRVRGGADEIFAREFNGTTWVALGAGNGNVTNTPNSDSIDPTIILMPNNTNQPVVAWTERFRDLTLGNVGATATYVRRWTGLTWAEMGAGSAGVYPDPNTDARGLNAAGINADNGVATVDIDTGAVVNDYHVFSNGPRLIGDALGNAAIVFRNGQWRNRNVEYRNGIHIRRFNGNSSIPAYEAWEDVGRVAGGDPGADSTLLAKDLAVAGQANGLALHVAADLGRSGFNQLRVLLWTGSGWSVQGLLPIATGTGEFSTPFFPSIGLDANGRPILTWNQAVGAQFEVYVRGRGTDAGGAIIWQEVGTGSATGGGISSNAGLSGLAALAIHRTGGNNTAVVAWDDGSDPVTQDGQIYIRRALLPAVTSSAPDLVVTAVSNPPATALPGGSFSVTDTTRNQGTGAAGGSTTRYYLSLDRTITGADVLVGSRSVPGLAAGASSSGSGSVTVPPTIAPGTYYLGACADDLGAVVESDEGNNCRASTTGVKVLVMWRGEGSQEQVTGTGPGEGAPVTSPPSPDPAATLPGPCADPEEAACWAEESTTRVAVAGATVSHLVTAGISDSPPISAPVGTRFPIATTASREMSIGVAFDGTNYLVGVQGDAASRHNITAQLVSQSGTLVGPRISVGRTGGAPLVAFDGTNYLMVWSDDVTHPNENIYGQFISPSGALVGPPFPIGQASGRQELGIGAVAFDGTNYLVVWEDFRNDTDKDEQCDPGETTCADVYGRFVTPSGSLLGPEIPISTQANDQRFPAIVFGATNYLVVWLSRRSGPELWDVYGRFITKAGGLSDPFVISEIPSPSLYPANVAFEGENYLVAWSRDVGAGSLTIWDIYGRTVSPSGVFGGPEFPVTSAAGDQAYPFIAFDGTNFLVTWTDTRQDTDTDWICDSDEGTCWDIYGQFMSPSGALIGSEFPINTDAGNQFASPVVFGGGKYLVVWVSGDTPEDGAIGDVYGVFVTPLTAAPDLMVSSLSNPPASAPPGGSFSVTDTTRNQGTAAAGASTTRYYLSLDQTITGADVLVGSRSVPSLAAGASSTGSVNVTVPLTIAPGTYYLGACADDLGAVAESNEGNNCRASTTGVKVLVMWRGSESQEQAAGARTAWPRRPP